jgi:hypothetical protein
MWMLMAFFIWNAKPALMAQEFSSKEACLFAGQEINQRWDQEERGYDFLKYVCVPK